MFGLGSLIGSPFKRIGVAESWAALQVARLLLEAIVSNVGIKLDDSIMPIAEATASVTTHIRTKGASFVAFHTSFYV